MYRKLALNLGDAVIVDAKKLLSKSFDLRQLFGASGSLGRRGTEGTFYGHQNNS